MKKDFPVNTKHLYNICTMLDQRRAMFILIRRVGCEKRFPSKHKTFVYDLYNVGPTSKTLGRHCTNVESCLHINPR